MRRSGAAAAGSAWVASRSPGTCRESLWLLPSGPDQVHDHAMRGDPPLNGCAASASRDYRSSPAPGQGCAPGGRAGRASIMAGAPPPPRMPIIDLIAARSLCAPALTAGALVVATLCAGGCERTVAPPPPPPPKLPANELVVAVRPGPASYFQGPDGKAIGLA